MATNILSTLKSKFSGPLAENSATFFKEEHTSTSQAVDGSFAVILAGMIQKVSTEKGAKDLHNTLRLEEAEDYDLQRIFERSPQTVNGLVNRGNHFLPKIYPSNLREATNALAIDSEMKKNNTAKLTRISTPLVLSVLGKHVQDNNLDANGLKSLLDGQKGDVKSALSDKFFEEAKLKAFGWTEKVVAKPAPKPKKVKVKKEKPVKVEKAAVVEKAPVVAPAEVSKGGLGFFKWLIPLLLLLGLIWLLMTKGCGAADKVAATVPKVAPKMPKVEKVVEAVKSPFGKMNEAAMGLLKDIKFTAGSAGQQMMNFLKSNKGGGEGRFRFTNLNFASGSATIAGESGLEVDNLSSILKAYEDIKVKVEGYTDSRGKAESNQALSQKRAEAVRARLVASGISESRISTEGFGAANPVASNDTAEGRAENRRIEVVIVK